jgi:hypothetical protein
MIFYESVLEYCRTNNTLFSKEYDLLEKHIDDGYSGKGWAHYDSNLGDLSWPFEEASVARFLRLENDVLFNEIKQFAQFLENKINCCSKPGILNDLIKFQIFLLTLRQYLGKVKSEEFLFDWKSYFVDESKIIQNSKIFHYQNQITEPDPIKWIWEVVWFGHKEIKYKFNPAFLDETTALTTVN